MRLETGGIRLERLLVSCWEGSENGGDRRAADEVRYRIRRCRKLFIHVATSLQMSRHKDLFGKSGRLAGSHLARSKERGVVTAGARRRNGTAIMSRIQHVVVCGDFIEAA